MNKIETALQHTLVVKMLIAVFALHLFWLKKSSKSQRHLKVCGGELLMHLCTHAL